MSAEPEVQLEVVGDVLCPIHGEPYRENWPSGAALAMVTLSHAWTHDPETASLTDGDAGRLQEALAKMRPLCCRYPAAWREAIDEAFSDNVGRCNVCGAEAVPGAPYSWTDDDGDPRRWAHLCFDCVHRQAVAAAKEE